jgi:hypothetical protein
MNNIHWNIAGAFTHHKILMPLFIRKSSNIYSVYDGLNFCAWNGGRLNYNVHYDESIYKMYKKYNVGVGLTFSNMIIDNLNDKTGNMLLEIFHEENNHIVVSNNRLLDYIRNKFPKYKIKRSVSSIFPIHVPMQDSDIKEYKESEKIYDLIVPRYEHIFDERFIELNQSKYEIMTNDTCIYNCPWWDMHFSLHSELNRKYADKNPRDFLSPEECKKIEECWIPGFDPCIGDLPTIKKYGENYGMDLTHKQLDKLIDRGIRHFKISGREMPPEEFKDHLDNYIFNYNRK